MRFTHDAVFVVVTACLIATLASVYNFYAKHNYMIVAIVPCDPSKFSCFGGDGTDSPVTYSEVHSKAYLVPKCDSWAGTCPQLSCADTTSQDCFSKFCDPSQDEGCIGKRN